jgi:predicted metalloendopeptidase
MGFYNKLKWVLGILMVFVIIVSTNLIDRNNFIRVKDSVVTIYEDRLVATDLIFEMSEAVHMKELAIALTDSIYYTRQNKEANQEVVELISRYELTRLTENESKIFKELKNNLETLMTLEITYVKSKYKQKDLLNQHISELKQNLSELSKIQINEGRKQMSISRKAIDTVELFTQIEIYLLVFLAIIIQIIVMYKPKKK